MKLRIDYDGETYWVVGDGQRLWGRSTYGYSERDLFTLAGVDKSRMVRELLDPESDVDTFDRPPYVSGERVAL